jgi:hypothetical protein
VVSTQSTTRYNSSIFFFFFFFYGPERFFIVDLVDMSEYESGDPEKHRAQ